MQTRYLQTMVKMLEEKRVIDYLKVFDLLTGYDQSQDVELWKQLKKTLSECKSIIESDKDSLEHITMMQDETAIKNNWWWYYPDRWTDD